jgi:SAM-dependent methyltransferase
VKPAAPDVPAALTRRVVAHYEERLASHGPTAQGMDWKDEASQRLRFAVLCEVTALAGKTVCDVGCGVGHLYDHLQAAGTVTSYRGIDLSSQMIDAARRRLPAVPFECRDVLRDDATGMADVVLSSGVFHVKLEHDDAAWWDFVTAMLRRLWGMSREALAFNLMSDEVDFRSPVLFYAKAADVLAFCRRELSRWMVLRHDYPLHEYTVYVYRHPRV